MVSITELKEIATVLRRDVLKMTTSAGSGHPTSCLSAAEIIACLFFHEMKYEITNAYQPENDEFILSKGHAAPILYAALFRSKCTDTNLHTLRQFHSPLEGHPLPGTLPWIKVATGSLGQGAAVGIGMAIAAKYQKRNARTYVLLGDSECAEGSVYEALEIAPKYKLDNLCLIVDVNRLGQSGETLLGHDIHQYKQRFAAFGWNVLTADGHNIPQLLAALAKARKQKGKPSIILAKTLKGKGVPFLENKEGWHGKALSEEQLEKALKILPDPFFPVVKIKHPGKAKQQERIWKTIEITDSKEDVATRVAFGKGLAQLAKLNPEIITLDAEVKNSTETEEVEKKTPHQFIQSYIAEQNMIGMALGLSTKRLLPVASTFAAFLTRAHDQLRMAALSQANMIVNGSHVGISIGEDGPSQMALEDIALFRTLPHSTIFYPSDGVSTEAILNICGELPGLKYIRTTRPKTPMVYKKTEKFEVGEFKVHTTQKQNSAVIAAAGITFHEAMKAAKRLEGEGIPVAVVDCYCIKPFNGKRFVDLLKKSNNTLVIVEDHYAEGGLGEMLLSEIKNENIAVEHLCVKEMPHSGSKERLLEEYNISEKAIVRTIRKLCNRENE